MCNQLHACGGYSVDTTENYVEILSFTTFYKHAHFVPNGENGRKKVMKNHIEDSVGIELVCVNTTE